MNKARTFLAVSVIAVAATTATPDQQQVAGGPAMPSTSAAPVVSTDTRQPALPPTAELPGAVVYAETDEQVELAKWALARFAAADLELPTVELHLHADVSKCGGPYDRHWLGYHVVRDGRHIVHSCGDGWITLHELGHAWDYHTLNDADRATLLDKFGLDDWAAAEWSQSGRELVASIIAWAIDESSFRPPWFDDTSDEALAKGYLWATGMQPPDLLSCGIHVTEAGLVYPRAGRAEPIACGTIDVVPQTEPA